METKKQFLKRLRFEFFDDCMERDNYVCVKCKKNKAVDVHHITDRHEMPNMGYVKENGISLCSTCHLKAEDKTISENELYKLIKSSKEVAEIESKLLKRE